MRKILLGVVLLIVCVVGCSKKVPMPPPRFTMYEQVQATIDGGRVMIYDIRQSYGGTYWRYQCRVGGERQVRRDGLVSADSPITRYSLVWFDEGELSPLEE